MERAQGILDDLRQHEDAGLKKKRVILEKTKNSAVLGAGVAAALAATYGMRSGEEGQPLQTNGTVCDARLEEAGSLLQNNETSNGP